MDGKYEHIVPAGEDGVVEYESDPEEVSMSLAMRRREASDDEEGGIEDTEKSEKSLMRMGSRGGTREWDDEGAVEQYDYEESEIEEYEEVNGVEEIAEEDEYVERGINDVKGGVQQVEVEGERVVDKEGDGEGVDQLEDEKKVSEPFAIPTSGAFYMHDDRFRDNAGGKHRRMLGGKKLWESKEDGKWGHDKFEEMTLHERHYDNSKERRNNGGQNGAGRKYQGENRGYPRGNKAKFNNDNQINGPKTVRGRGPRRYGNAVKTHIEVPSTQNFVTIGLCELMSFCFVYTSRRSVEKASNTSSGALPNVETDSIPHRKQNFASSLNSASPPFYPSSSSNKEIPLAQKRDLHTGPSNRNLRPVSMEKPYIHESVSSASGKPSTSSPSVSYGSQVHGRGVASQRHVDSSTRISHNQMIRPPLTQAHGMHQSAVHDKVQTSLAVSAHDLGRSSSVGSQNSSSPGTSLPVESFKSFEQGLPPELIISKVPLVAKGIGNVQASGNGSFLYGGAHVIGTSGNMTSHGDQNFAATPAFLPVMPFGGQHPGRMGVPAVGMAFPGYVAQQQLGMGTSEMTWLPVLAGAAGSLGATYCSPYISVDGSYHVRQSGQSSSSSAPSIENGVDKSSVERKPSQRQGQA
ncbi:protein MLN51 homolog [Impatiens glandulifera]|uniref:protein MLN51 homolog n=1 Tax=Impatiens glandulifera TaxID=253017 RepID=UPI001FB11F67|nr:protein MLN51 homolog [Impatiens glandulifera]